MFANIQALLPLYRLRAAVKAPAVQAVEAGRSSMPVSTTHKCNITLEMVNVTQLGHKGAKLKSMAWTPQSELKAIHEH